MNHQSLKIDIQIAQASARIQRKAARDLLTRGRALRKKARSCSDKDAAEKLHAAGEACRWQGLNQRASADEGAQTRRAMHIAAALLNGKTYHQCETTTKKPPVADIGRFLAGHLLHDENPHAEFLANMWVSMGDKTLTQLRAEGPMAARSERERLKRDINAKKFRAHTLSREVTQIQNKQTDYERCARECETNISNLQYRKKKYEEDARAVAVSVAPKKAELTALYAEIDHLEARLREPLADAA